MKKNKTRENAPRRLLSIVFAVMVVFLYPTVSNAGSCAKQLASEVLVKSAKWWMQTSDEKFLYCGTGEDYGCAGGQIIFTGKDFYRCNEQTGVDSWRYISINDITNCSNGTDFRGMKVVSSGQYLVYYKAGSLDHMVANNNDICKLGKLTVEDKCGNSGGYLDADYKCNCFNKEFDAKTLSCKEQVRQESEKQESEKSAEQKACEDSKGTWTTNKACSCSGNYYTKDNKSCTEKKPGEACSAADLASITGAASGVYNNNLKCVLKECKDRLQEVVKNGVPQGWCNTPQAQSNDKAQGGANWWTLLVGSIK